MADGSSHPTLAPNWLLEEFGPPDRDGTWGGLSLADMTHDFAPASEDEEDPRDLAPSAEYLMKWERTWSV